MVAATRQGVEIRGRLNANAWRCDGGRLITTQLGLFDMYVDEQDESLTPHLINDGFWESWITAWTINNIKPGMNCVDIGANQGYFTFLLAKLVGQGGGVWAFEPMPRYSKLLKETRTLEALHNVFLFPFAVSDGLDYATLTVPGNLRGSASIAVESFDGKYGAEETYHVRTAPLDYYAPGVVDFVKIDAEGAEDKIWSGMQRTIQRNPNITIAMEFDAQRGYDKSFIEDMFETMHVTAIDFQGNEYPITEQELFLGTDWVMLVLRRNNN